jgi:hypothetical protein
MLVRFKESYAQAIGQEQLAPPGAEERSPMKHIIWTALAVLAASVGLVLFAGKDDIRRLYRMRRM